MGQDAFRYIDRLTAGGEFFDIIFADPPYAGSTAGRIVEAVVRARRPLCVSLVVEHGKPLDAGEEGVPAPDRTRRFGQTRVSYFEIGKTGETKGKEGGLRE